MIMEILVLNFEEILLEYKNNINKELLNVYNNGPNNIKEPIYHILHGGKRLRPILCKLVCLCCEGCQKSADIASTSIELLHNFTLIHDDIMDNDILRHGRETIHHKWNDSIAILSGDAMLAIALNRLAKIKENKIIIMEKFNEALIQVCEGQALDLKFQNISNVSEKEYLTMIDKKTGYMIGLSAEIGAIISHLNTDIQKKFKQYGLLIGRAFQIQDDLLEIVSNQDKMGKSLKSDFLLGKKTYISIKAKSIDENYISHVLKEANEDYNKGFKLYLEFLNKHDIINDTKSYIAELLDNTNSLLSSVDINRENLHSFTKYVLKREY